jgi:hypothetical protein
VSAVASTNADMGRTNVRPVFLPQRRHPCRSRYLLENTGELGMAQYYSYFSVSTGSSLAARFAGTVPKITPTMTDVPSAITAERQSTGIL